MVLPLAYPGEGWIRCKGIGVFIHSDGPGDPYIWVGDVGCDPPHGVDPGGGGFHHQMARRLTEKFP